MSLDRSNILAIGCGGCGCSQLDILMDLDIRYSGIFMNTNLSEMENLKHFDQNRRSFYIANADGTGKNRDVAAKYIKEDAPKFAEVIRRYINQTYVIFLGGMSGGTGSKAMIMLSKLTKRLCPEKSVNIIATFPDCNLSILDYKNTIDTWNELIELREKGIIDSLQFINNNKCEDLSIDLQGINIKAMNDLNDSFNIIGNKLDSSDFERTFKSKGYRIMLKLDPAIKSIDFAIKQSLYNSVFYGLEALENFDKLNAQNQFECDAFIGNVNTDIYDLNVIQKKIKSYDIDKFNIDKSQDTFIILGGCSLPTEGIDWSKEMLENLLTEKKERKMNKDLFINIDKNINDNNTLESINKEIASTTTTDKKSSSKLSSKDIKNLFEDDFWDK